MNIENVEFQRGVVSPIECVSEGWGLLMQNLGIYIVIGLIAILLAGCLGIIAIGWFLYGPLMVGIYYVYLRQIRGEQIEIGMMFKGFSKFLPAMVIGLIVLFPSIIARIYDTAFQIAEFAAIYNPNELTAGLLMAVWLISIGLKSVILVATVIINILLMFSFPLLFEREMGLMDTMKLSAKAGWANAGGLFLLLLLNGLIIIAGALACLVGLLFAIPLVFASNAVAYRKVFPEEGPQNFAPPQPDQYAFQ